MELWNLEKSWWKRGNAGSRTGSSSMLCLRLSTGKITWEYPGWKWAVPRFPRRAVARGKVYTKAYIHRSDGGWVQDRPHRRAIVEGWALQKQEKVSLIEISVVVYTRSIWTDTNNTRVFSAVAKYFEVGVNKGTLYTRRRERQVHQHESRLPGRYYQACC